ncbi:unnamed protein product, partial [Allacma fusca]
QEIPEKAPLILWINDVPGFSSVQAIFRETGPFKVDGSNAVSERNTSWTKSHSMLYIDSPVGTGFSFSDTEDAFANNSGEEGDEIYEALHQFFTLFKEFQEREFYLAGENYAASFIPYIVRRIETENDKGELKINVKGFIIGSPFIDVQQLYKAQALYDFGLIDLDQKKIFDETMDKAINLIMNGQAKEGTQLVVSTYIGPDSLLTKFTGFKDYDSVLISKPTPEMQWFQNFIDSKEVHKYLHVGVHKYIDKNYSVLDRFAKEITSSHGQIIQEMLNKQYRILFYASQFNIFFPQNDITKLVNNLKWNGADKFSKASRKIWKVNDDVAGYIKMADNFVYAIVRNAGNYAIQDQPAWVLDLVEKFLYNKEF